VDLFQQNTNFEGQMVQCISITQVESTRTHTHTHLPPLEPSATQIYIS